MMEARALLCVDENSKRSIYRRSYYCTPCCWYPCSNEQFLYDLLWPGSSAVARGVVHP